MTTKHLPSIGVLNTFVRNMKYGGATREQIAASMRRRLNLERFDPEALSEAERMKYEELREFLKALEGSEITK